MWQIFDGRANRVSKLLIITISTDVYKIFCLCHKLIIACSKSDTISGMDLEKEINAILFKIGQEVKIHKIDSNNTIIEIDYDKYTVELLRMFMNYLSEDS
jgi:hypothetical protein